MGRQSSPRFIGRGKPCLGSSSYDKRKGEEKNDLPCILSQRRNEDLYVCALIGAGSKEGKRIPSTELARGEYGPVVGSEAAR